MYIMDRKVLLWMNQFSPIFDESLKLFATKMGTTHSVSIIDTNKYENNFISFYQQHMEKYDTTTTATTTATTTTTTTKSFCYDGLNGIKEPNYMPRSAKGPKKATLISADINGDGQITEIHAILTFSLIPRRKIVEVDLLCKNQVLSIKSGEGSKLLKLLETVSLELGYLIVKLTSIPSATSYYQTKWYQSSSKRKNSPTMTKNVRYVSNVQKMKYALTKTLRKSRASQWKKENIKPFSNPTPRNAKITSRKYKSL